MTISHTSYNQQPPLTHHLSTLALINGKGNTQTPDDVLSLHQRWLCVKCRRRDHVYLSRAGWHRALQGAASASNWLPRRRDIQLRIIHSKSPHFHSISPHLCFDEYPMLTFPLIKHHWRRHQSICPPALRAPLLRPHRSHDLGDAALTRIQIHRPHSGLKRRDILPTMKTTQ